MAVFEQIYKVKISNVGPNGLITNMGILSILEDIACKHSDKAGFGILDIPVKHLSWVILAWKVNILKRVQYSTSLRVCTWAKVANKFQTCRDFEIYDENGDLVCIATSKWALIDTEKNSITRITENIIDKYSPENNNVFKNPDIDKLNEPNSFSHEYIYETQRRDIDVNQHMHNLNYLDVAYEALPEEVYNLPECNHIEIMYRKGIRLGDTVKCLYSLYDGSHYVTLKSIDEKVLHAIVKLY